MKEHQARTVFVIGKIEVVAEREEEILIVIVTAVGTMIETVVMIEKGKEIVPAVVILGAAEDRVQGPGSLPGIMVTG